MLPLCQIRRFGAGSALATTTIIWKIAWQIQFFDLGVMNGCLCELTHPCLVSARRGIHIVQCIGIGFMDMLVAQPVCLARLERPRVPSERREDVGGFLSEESLAIAHCSDPMMLDSRSKPPPVERTPKLWVEQTVSIRYLNRRRNVSSERSFYRLSRRPSGNKMRMCRRTVEPLFTCRLPPKC